MHSMPLQHPPTGAKFIRIHFAPPLWYGHLASVPLFFQDASHRGATCLQSPQRSLLGVSHVRKAHVAFLSRQPFIIHPKGHFHPIPPSFFNHAMRPLLNKDFRRLRWLLRQGPPRRVRGSFPSFMCHSFWWLIPLADYVTREVASLCRGGVYSGILSRLRKTLRKTRMKMAHAISALCFVSRMRLRDRGGTNVIPLDRRMHWALYRFFNSAAFCGPVSD